MKKFSDFNIRPVKRGMVGEKIKISRLLNQEIIVHSYKINESKFNKNSSQCLCLQIEVKGEMKVVFTGSKILMETIQKVPEQAFPFLTIITQEGEAFQFN